MKLYLAMIILILSLTGCAADQFLLAGQRVNTYAADAGGLAEIVAPGKGNLVRDGGLLVGGILTLIGAVMAKRKLAGAHKRIDTRADEIAALQEE